MQDIGVKLGADVPACFFKRPIIARGIGEEIEEIKSNMKYYIVIIKPIFSCNTKEMYERFDRTLDFKQEYNSERVKCAIQNKDINQISRNLYNVFENAVDGVNDVKNEFIKLGAKGTLMTGSGSCIYGIFDEKNIAKDAYRILKELYNTYFCVAI